MQIFKYSLCALLSGFVFTGCFSTYSFTFDSVPSGAAVVCDGKHQGYTPLVMNANAEFEKLPDVLPLSGCSANWISGYSKNYKSIKKIDYPNGFIQTLDRPNDGSGYEKDIYFSLQLKSLNTQQREAAAIEIQVNQQALQNMNQNIQNMNNNLQMQQQNYQMQNLNNNLNNINNTLKNNYKEGGYYNK